MVELWAPTRASVSEGQCILQANSLRDSHAGSYPCVCVCLAGLRDFTINAIFFDPLTGDVLDFIGGVRDLKDKVRTRGRPLLGSRHCKRAGIALRTQNCPVVCVCVCARACMRPCTRYAACPCTRPLQASGARAWDACSHRLRSGLAWPGQIRPASCQACHFLVCMGL